MTTPTSQILHELADREAIRAALKVDPAEAMSTIDVNTGAFVGHRTLEETIFKTNLEAATAIARQLRLRNLGGLHADPAGERLPSGPGGPVVLAGE